MEQLGNDIKKLQLLTSAFLKNSLMSLVVITDLRSDLMFVE